MGGEKHPSGEERPGGEHPKECTAPRCLVCGEGLTRRDLVLCRDCRAPHHERCWSFNKGCATYACSCRTFVAPPGGVDDLMEFEVRGRPNLFGVLSAFLVYFLAAALLKPYVLLSKPLAKVVLRSLKPFCWAWVFAAALGPLVTRRRYLLDRQLGKVGRRLQIGAFPIRSQDDWLDFQDVAGLEVRLAEIPGRHPFETRKGVEVWLRLGSGERHLVDRGSYEELDALLRQASEAAELLDTTLGLPRGLAGTEALPAGLATSLAGIPAGSEGVRALPGGGES